MNHEELMEKLALAIKGVKTELQPHQEEALDKILSSDTGQILSHGLGSGKTLSSIAAANALGYPTDVVVPASLMSNYQKEIEKHTDENSVPFNIISMQNLAMHPEILRNNFNDSDLETILRKNPRTLIVDEAHRLRNEKIKASKALEGVPYAKKILLTGTPIYNNPADLAALIDMLDKEPDPHQRLTPSRIRKFYGNELDTIKEKELRSSKNMINMGDLNLELKNIKEDLRNYIIETNRKNKNNNPNNIFDYRNSKNTINYLKNNYGKEYLEVAKKKHSNKDILKLIARSIAIKKKEEKVKEKVQHEFEHHDNIFQDKIDKFVHYYEGGNTEDYPEKKFKTISVPMEESQYEQYNMYFKKIPENLRNKILNNTMETLPPSEVQNPFLVKTRMVANQFMGSSPKIDKMIDDIRNEKGKTVVYSNFLENGLYPMRDRLDREGIPYALYSGEEKKSVKDQIIKDYNAGKIKVLLLSSAGGEGLDLKNTKQVQIMEPHWNEEKINQVIGRAARYKSHTDLDKNDRNVNIKYYVSVIPGQENVQTTETYLRNMGSFKKQLASKVIDKMKKESGIGRWLLYEMIK